MADSDLQLMESKDLTNLPLKINVKIDSTFWQLFNDDDFLTRDTLKEMLHFRSRTMIPTKQILMGGYNLQDQLDMLRYKTLNNRFFVIFHDITKKAQQFWVADGLQVNTKMRDLESQVKQLRRMRDQEAYRARIRIKEEQLERQAKQAQDKPKN